MAGRVFEEGVVMASWKTVAAPGLDFETGDLQIETLLRLVAYRSADHQRSEEQR